MKSLLRIFSMSILFLLFVGNSFCQTPLTHSLDSIKYCSISDSDCFLEIYVTAKDDFGRHTKWEEFREHSSSEDKRLDRINTFSWYDSNNLKEKTKSRCLGFTSIDTCVFTQKLIYHENQELIAQEFRGYIFMANNEGFSLETRERKRDSILLDNNGNLVEKHIQNSLDSITWMTELTEVYHRTNNRLDSISFYNYFTEEVKNKIIVQYFHYNSLDLLILSEKISPFFPKEIKTYSYNEDNDLSVRKDFTISSLDTLIFYYDYGMNYEEDIRLSINQNGEVNYGVRSEIYFKEDSNITDFEITSTYNIDTNSWIQSTKIQYYYSLLSANEDIPTKKLFVKFNNPVSNILNVEIRDNNNILPYTVFDRHGAYLQKGFITTNQQIDLSDYLNGLYYLNVGGLGSRSFVVAK